MIKKIFSRFFSKNVETNMVSNVRHEELKETVHAVILDTLQKRENQVLGPSHVLADPNASIQKMDKSSLVDFRHPRVQELLKEYNKNFFAAFNLSEKDYKLKFNKHNLVVFVQDKDFEENLSKSDKLSLAYEHVFMRILQSEFKNFEHRLSLEAGNSAYKHKEYISHFTQKLIAKVKKTGRKVHISSKSSYERRLMHAIVEKANGVSSKSVGVNHNRKLTIYPMNQKTP